MSNTIQNILQNQPKKQGDKSSRNKEAQEKLKLLTPAAFPPRLWIAREIFNMSLQGKGTMTIAYSHAVKLIVIAILLIAGNQAMSADIKLTWEWPADRVAEQKLLVRIVDVKNQSAGFFGFGKTPSFAGNLPDPVTVKAELIDREGELQGKTVELTLPEQELESINVGDYAILGMVDSDVCICIDRAAFDTDVKDFSCP